MRNPDKRAVGDCPQWSPGSMAQEWRGFLPAPASWGKGACLRHSAEPAGPETHSHSGPDTLAVAWGQRQSVLLSLQNNICDTDCLKKHGTDFNFFPMLRRWKVITISKEPASHLMLNQSTDILLVGPTVGSYYKYYINPNQTYIFYETQWFIKAHLFQMLQLQLVSRFFF